MLSNFTAVLDANVMYPAPLRDLLIQVGAEGLYRARWTDQITDEWTRNLLANRADLTANNLSYTVELMANGIPGCIVTGYDPIIEGLTLPDPDDRHVLAAAIKCSAQVIVTYNLKDFPEEILSQYGVEPKHPDEFLQDCYDVAPPAFISCVKTILKRLKNPPKTPQELIDTYRGTHELTLTASSLEAVIELLN